MHAAKLENSARLHRTLKALSDGEEHSTLDLIQEAGICAVNSACSELRVNGYDIRCVRRGRYWYYRLMPESSRRVKQRASVAAA